MIAWFEDLPANATATAGGKGASLSRMKAAGLPVPRGFVVCADTFGASLEAANGVDFIRSLTDTLDVQDRAALEITSSKICAFIDSQPLSKAIDEVIHGAYLEMGPELQVA